MTDNGVVCCGVLQCVTVCCRVIHKETVSNSFWFLPTNPRELGHRLTFLVLQRVAVSCSVLPWVAVCCSVLQCAAVCCSVLQCAAVCCSVVQCGAVWSFVLQCVAVRYSVLQCVAVISWHFIYFKNMYESHQKSIWISHVKNTSEWPHEKLIGILLVSNPSTENLDINPGSLNGYKWEMPFSSELIVQIKQKGVYRVQNPLPRSFLGGSRQEYIWVSHVKNTSEQFTSRTHLNESHQKYVMSHVKSRPEYAMRYVQNMSHINWRFFHWIFNINIWYYHNINILYYHNMQ